MRNASLRVALTLEQCWHRVPGGTAVAAIGMARALRQRDVDVIGVAARHASPAPPEWEPPVEIAQLPLPRALLYETWHHFRRPSVESATGPVDVIHATSLAVAPRKAPLVVTIHDLAFLHEPHHFTHRGMRLFERGLELARAEADLIHCPSAATKWDCAAQGFPEEKLRVIPLGIDIEEVPAGAVEPVLARHGITRPYVLWTGTLEPRKNLKLLLEAFARIESEATLVLVGPKGWGEDLSAQPNVKALGFLPPTERDALYAGASAFCWPSLREGFGFPVLEAMAQGAPVITSRGTSTEEIAGEAGILVEPTDVAEVAGALERLLSDQGLREELSTNGRRQAAKFTWRATADALIDAYSEIV